MNEFAQEFSQIQNALTSNADIQDRMLALIGSESIAGKVTEDGNQLECLREALRDLTTGAIGLDAAFARIEFDLPRSESAHAGNNRVFPSGWAERLVRTQFSRFYNQAVLEHLLAMGETECFVAVVCNGFCTGFCTVHFLCRASVVETDGSLPHPGNSSSSLRGGSDREPLLRGQRVRAPFALRRSRRLCDGAAWAGGRSRGCRP
jgi:hypothetical protein